MVVQLSAQDARRQYLQINWSQERRELYSILSASSAASVGSHYYPVPSKHYLKEKKSLKKDPFERYLE